MKSCSPIRRPVRSTEEGYVLIAVIFLVALLTISLSIALPKVAKEIQRDRELETMHRGKQFIRAIKFYQKKFGSYPMTADALTKPTNNIRFLRKKYTDPTTGLPDWKPVLFGHNKAPTAMGFFGQPLGGSGGCAPNPFATASTSSPTTSLPGGATGSPTDAGSNCAGGLGTSTTTSTDTSATSTTDPSAAGGGAAASTSAFGQPGQTFGGAGIIGFSPNSPKQSILVYKKMNHYNGWEFVYDPRAEMMQGGAPIGAPLQPGAPGVPLPTTPQTPTPQTPPTQ